MWPSSDRLTRSGATADYVAFAIVLMAMVLRVWGLDAGLPHLMTRPDEELILLRTREPASGIFFLNWQGLHPGIPSAFIYLLWIWGEVALRVMQFFGAAPAGDYVTVLSTSPDRILLAERFFSVGAGVASVALLIWISRRELGNRVSLVAGLILATSVFHVRDSHSVKPDIALGLFAIAALGLLAPLARDLNRRGACWAGLAIGFAMAMKLPGVLLLVPAWLVCIQGSSETGWRRIFPAEIFWMTGVAAVFFVGTSPDFVFNGETLAKILDIPRLAFPQWAQGTEVPLADAGLPEVARPTEWRRLFYHFEFSLRYGLGLPLVLLFPVALIWGLFSRQTILVLCGTFFLVAFLVFSPSPVLLSRYMTPLLPVVALLLAGFLVRVGDSLGVFHSGTRGVLAMGALLLLIAEPFAASIRFDRLMSLEDTRVTAHRWLSENTNPGDRIALDGAVGWFWGDPQIPDGREIQRPSFSPDGLASLSANYLVIHDHPLFSSAADWQGIEQLGDRLRVVAEFDPFTGGGGSPLYELQDAFYVPTRGFSGVTVPGPHIRIYAVDLSSSP